MYLSQKDRQVGQIAIAVVVAALWVLAVAIS